MSNKLNVHRFFVMSQALICLDFVYPQFGRNDFRTVVLFEIDAIAQGTAILDFDFQERDVYKRQPQTAANRLTVLHCMNSLSCLKETST